VHEANSHWSVTNVGYINYQHDLYKEVCESKGSVLPMLQRVIFVPTGSLCWDIWSLCIVRWSLCNLRWSLCIVKQSSEGRVPKK